MLAVGVSASVLAAVEDVDGGEVAGLLLLDRGPIHLLHLGQRELRLAPGELVFRKVHL